MPRTILRWHVTISYGGIRDPEEFDVEELYEVHDIVERGPDWNEIGAITIILNGMRHADPLVAAAKRVLAGLEARIDEAPGNAKPVFDGIAELHDALSLAEGRTE
jgi:hypothetical protein